MTLGALGASSSESPLVYDSYLSDKSGFDSAESRVWKSSTFLAGCVICLVSALNCLNVFSIFTPSLYLLNIVQGLFGVVLVILEGDSYSSLEPYATWIETYFRFMHLQRGKAAFLALVAVHALVLTSLSVLYLLVALVCAAMATVLLVGPGNNNNHHRHASEQEPLPL